MTKAVTFAAEGTSTGCLIYLGNFTGLTVGTIMFINTSNLIPLSAEL
jgi:hypothetical protein